MATFEYEVINAEPPNLYLAASSNLINLNPSKVVICHDVKCTFLLKLLKPAYLNTIHVTTNAPKISIKIYTDSGILDYEKAMSSDAPPQRV